MAVLLLINYLVARAQGANLTEVSTTCSIIVMIVGMWVILCLARPLKVWKVVLMLLLAGAFAALLSTESIRDLAGYSLHEGFILLSVALGLAGIVAIETLWRTSALKNARTA